LGLIIETVKYNPELYNRIFPNFVSLKIELESLQFMRNPVRPVNCSSIATRINGFLYQCQDFLALPVYAPDPDFRHR